ncbi:GGDEF domain-containing protein [Rhodovastum atsumiense]|uniref:GGDEF domain-containing protein n=1 Tax=Rhodovastum atsumiense TaxID=504468 RepID=A0A5M6ILT6_9PROT|nr:GGDEF domain-containing protein [Rhodovastum atsumiense]KAA5608897.1 GGDEF domain-containing protein [Rhodovastum atsumiense]CAH2602296.1 GGDEF domain-containing protein [Rhodovastum atsumiense]
MDEGFHRLLRRQIQRARTSSGEIDYAALLAEISAAYEEADRDRRRTDRAATLMCEEMEELHETLRRQALQDALTGLGNRLLFRQYLHEAAQRGRRGLPFALILIDLDRFKAVNDSLGHQAGDRLLVEVAVRMRAHVRDHDTLARLGGDEFAILLDPIRNAADADAVAARIVGVICKPFELNGSTAVIGASVGIAVHMGEHPCDPERLLERADKALYQVKENGRNNWHIAESA